MEPTSTDTSPTGSAIGGSGLAAYIICMIIIPREPETIDYTKEEYDDREN